MKASISVLKVTLMIDHQKCLPPDLEDFPIVKEKPEPDKNWWKQS